MLYMVTIQCTARGLMYLAGFDGGAPQFQSVLNEKVRRVINVSNARRQLERTVSRSVTLSEAFKGIKDGSGAIYKIEQIFLAGGSSS